MNIGERYVLTIADVFKGAESGKDKARVSGFDNLIFDDNGLSKLEKLEDVLQEACDNARREGYGEGLNTAWECARKIIPLWEKGKTADIFGTRDIETIFKRYFASDAISKIKEYEDERKRISKKESCGILDDKCPYMHLDCGDCEVYCSVHRALDRLKRMKGAE